MIYNENRLPPEYATQQQKPVALSKQQISRLVRLAHQKNRERIRTESKLTPSPGLKKSALEF